MNGRTLFLPYYGEFGWLVMNHIRYVHAHPSENKIVCCEPGMETLYPSASSFWTDYKNPVPDNNRCGDWAWAGSQGYADARAEIRQRAIGAHVGAQVVQNPRYDCHWHTSDSIKFMPKVRRSLPAIDVAICPRYREFVPEKNWPHWHSVVQSLSLAGLRIGVVGSKATSVILPSDEQAWTHPDGETAGTIDLLQGCRLFLGTDTGVSHLAALMDVPMVVFRREIAGNPDVRNVMARASSRLCRRLDEAAWDMPERITGAVLHSLSGWAEPAEHSEGFVSVDPLGAFGTAIAAAISQSRPKRVIETGSYKGSGTTAAIARALLQHSRNAQFFTIEINPERKKDAQEFGRRMGFDVTYLEGLSVPRSMLPTEAEIEAECQQADGVAHIDHGAGSRAVNYSAEVTTAGDDDLMGKCMSEFEDQPDFVLLDSAGHLGFVEFNYLLSRLKGPCIIALDDVNHVKHYRSLQMIRSDQRFNVLAQGDEKYGFCIAAFTG